MFFKVMHLLRSFIQLQKGNKQLHSAHTKERILKNQSLKDSFKQAMSNTVIVSETEVQTNLAEQKNDLSKRTNQ